MLGMLGMCMGATHTLLEVQLNTPLGSDFVPEPNNHRPTQHVWAYFSPLTSLDNSPETNTFLGYFLLN